MGAGASAQQAPFASIEEALAAGKTQEEIDTWQTTQGETKKPEDTAAAAAEAEGKPAAEATPEPEGTADAPEAEAATTPVITECTLKTFQEEIKKAIAEGKWPLLLDSNENSPLITFMNYQHFQCVEVKKGMAESMISKTKTIEEISEEWRCELSKAMVQKADLGSPPGRCLWLHFANSAVDFKNKFCGDILPIVMFDCKEMQKEEVKKKFIKEGEMGGAAIWGPDFSICLTSTFEVEDVFDFLGDSIPLDKLKIINVKNE